jgi:LacI family transcriptional regulator
VNSWPWGNGADDRSKPRQHARLAVELALRHLETGYQPHLFSDGKVEFILYSAENVD